MLAIVILSWILAQIGIIPALWAWFAANPLLTILLIIFIA